MACSMADPLDQPGCMISALHLFNGPSNDHPAENIFHQVQIIIGASERAVHIRDIPALTPHWDFSPLPVFDSFLPSRDHYHNASPIDKVTNSTLPGLSTRLPLNAILDCETSLQPLF